MGRTEFLPEADRERAVVGWAHLNESEMRALRSARSSTLKKQLTPLTLLAGDRPVVPMIVQTTSWEKTRFAPL
jgi:hypothetical protein